MEQLAYTTVDTPGSCPATPIASPYVAVTYQPTDVFPNGTASYCPLSQPSWSAYRWGPQIARKRHRRVSSMVSKT